MASEPQEQRRPKVSVIIPARNEQSCIAQCLQSLVDTAMPAEEWEVIVVDGGSTDGTRKIVGSFAAEHPNIRMVDNPQRITPVGFNLGIRACRGKAICIMSAHSYVEPQYLPECLKRMEEVNADIIGGWLVTISQDQGIQSRLIMAVLSSRFGVGGSFRTLTRDGPVDTAAYGVYRRTVFERFGLFDERLVRNQDNELAARVRAGGGLIWMTPKVRSFCYARPVFKKMLSQNLRNGLYCILTWMINPASFTVRHAVPFLFVLFLLLGIPLAIWSFPLRVTFLALLGLYGLLAIAASIQAGIHQKTFLAILLPLVFPCLHIAYGLGSLVGVFRFGLRKPAGPGPEKLPPLEDKPAGDMNQL